MENNFFRPAGDLNDGKSDLLYSKKIERNLTPIRKSEQYFRPAGDLDINLTNKIDDYLLTVVSDKKYVNVCGAGKTIVGFEQLKKMVDEGYNIVSAKVINADNDMIEVEFQEIIKSENRGMRR